MSSIYVDPKDVQVNKLSGIHELTDVKKDLNQNTCSSFQNRTSAKWTLSQFFSKT